MSLTFKMSASVTPVEQQELLRQLKGRGARSITPLFPGEKNPRLAGMHQVDADQSSEQDLLSHLQESAAVEFAERSPRRKAT